MKGGDGEGEQDLVRCCELTRKSHLGSVAGEAKGEGGVPTKRVVVKKWNAVAFWSYGASLLPSRFLADACLVVPDIENDTCAICHVSGAVICGPPEALISWLCLLLCRTN